MAKINKLDAFTANRIAAGEVIERPVSIVKELLENAIDAQSTAITVEIKSGGIGYIRVSDNGCGIDADDVFLAFERHATSKIEHAQDLDSIATLGFRGEALCSIAAVAQVELTTRTKDADSGSFVVVHGGELVSHKPIGSPGGTTLIAQNVFFNTPARLKFLKREATEAGYIGDYISRMIMAYPQLSIHFINDGKTVYHSPGDGELLNAIFCVYGRETVNALRKVDYSTPQISISGYIANSDHSKPNRTFQSFFINGRYIHSNLLSGAVQEAYGTRLMGGRFALCVLQICVGFDTVDVNIHPNKLEIRFDNEAMVAQSVITAVREAIGERIPQAWSIKKPAELPKPEEKQQTIFRSKISEHQTQSEKVSRQCDAPKPNVKDIVYGSKIDSMQSAKAAHASIDDAQLRNLVLPTSSYNTNTVVRESSDPVDFNKIDEPIRVIGQVFLTYLIVQQGETLYLIDQHAAHERMLFDKLVKSTESIASQSLLMPYEMMLTPVEMALLEKYHDDLLNMGFVIDNVDNLTIIKATPVVFEEAEAADFLVEILEDARESNQRSTAKLKFEQLAQCACKHAIKGRQPLTKLQIDALLSQFDQLGELNCPHGRPIILRITKRQIEKMFKRVL